MNQAGPLVKQVPARQSPVHTLKGPGEMQRSGFPSWINNQSISEERHETERPGQASPHLGLAPLHGSRGIASRVKLLYF